MRQMVTESPETTLQIMGLKEEEVSITKYEIKYASGETKTKYLIAKEVNNDFRRSY